MRTSFQSGHFSLSHNGEVLLYYRFFGNLFLEDPVDGSMILGINDTYSLSYASGRVVVRFNNRWNTICRNSFFSNTEADVICHQLTYSGASTWSYAAIDEYV